MKRRGSRCELSSAKASLGLNLATRGMIGIREHHPTTFSPATTPFLTWERGPALFQPRISLCDPKRLRILGDQGQTAGENRIPFHFAKHEPGATAGSQPFQG